MRAPASASWPGARDTAISGLVASITLLVLVLAGVAFGVAGLAAAIVAVIGVVLLQYPGPVVLGTVALVVVCEGPSFGLFPQTDNLYRDLVKGFMPLDGVLVIATVAVALQLLQDRRPVRLPPASLALALAFIILALMAGVVGARAHGIGLRSALLSVHAFGYLLLVPMLVVNLRVDALQASRVLGAALALAGLKALLGLASVALGRGVEVAGNSVLTYYEPTANWLMTVALASLVAAFVLKLRPPWWAWPLAGALLLAIVLSYRRSFWIGDVVALALVGLFGLATARRHLIVPVVVLVGVGAWLLGSVVVQSDTPLAQRVRSLSPSKVTTKPEDRYRLDERVNVVAEIRRDPIGGRGIDVPWRATARTLPVEVSPTHTYVHFAALFWWVHLGLLGLIAYSMVVVSGLWLSWRVWQHSRAPSARAFGLGSLCSIVGLGLIETTATFTGVDLRFTLLFGAQLGLLAVLASLSADERAEPVR